MTGQPTDLWPPQADIGIGGYLLLLVGALIAAIAGAVAGLLLHIAAEDFKTPRGPRQKVASVTPHLDLGALRPGPGQTQISFDGTGRRTAA